METVLCNRTIRACNWIYSCVIGRNRYKYYLTVCYIMVIHTCEYCHYTTTHKGTYNYHLQSKRHLEKVTNDQNIKYFECRNCKKKYNSRSGLCKHVHKCKPPVQTPILNQTVNNNIVNNITNNITNNIININLNFLNKHYNNAMNIGQFVETRNFNKDDYNEIDKRRFFIDGIMKVLEKHLEKISAEKLPIHCSATKKNRPTKIYIRDKDQWKQESQCLIEYQLKNFEEDDETNEEDPDTTVQRTSVSEDEAENDEEALKPVTMSFLEEFTGKFYDTYTELSEKNPNLKRIDDKMSVCGQSTTHIKMLEEIPNIKSLVLDPPSATNTDIDLNLLAT